MNVDNEMEDWRCILKLVAESAPSCKPESSIDWRGPHLCCVSKVGPN